MAPGKYTLSALLLAVTVALAFLARHVSIASHTVSLLYISKSFSNVFNFNFQILTLSRNLGHFNIIFVINRWNKYQEFFSCGKLKLKNNENALKTCVGEMKH